MRKTKRRQRPEAAADGPGSGRRVLHPGLLPVAPMLYLVWADGALSPEELQAASEVARALPALDEPARASLGEWLDPGNPPQSEDVLLLLETIRRAGGDKALEAAADPAALGALLAAGDESMAGALRELQEALGLGGSDAAAAVLSALAPAAPRPPRRRRAAGAAVREATQEPPDAAALNSYLDSDHLELRREVLALLSEPEFAYVDARDTAAYRETVLQWCSILAARGYGARAFPREFGGQHDTGGSIAVFETLAYHDHSMLVKYGVQFGLFAGSIYLLGTRRHHERYLKAAGTLELPGCFAMTETGHGSNVRDLRTTAEYDVATGEFVINTPDSSARKDYIGNAALHGRLAVVFAQLVTETGRHGVHAFLVPIRDDAGAPLAGVEIEDCGLKVGLNGVDNGRLSFHGVRIPRENLLDRYGSVSEGGAYTSPITSPTRRFFTMIGTLVAGRISIACASLSAAKSGLTIGIRYTDQRRQFGPEGEVEVPVLDYTVMQRSLLPRLATAYALDFALKALVRRFATLGTSGMQEVETQAAALKAYASDWTVETLQVVREACGGQGYLAENRLGRLRADTDVFTTFEGANSVLYQLVAKGRLTEYRHQFGELKLWTVARFVGARAATRVTELNPIITRRSDVDHLMDPSFHAAALRYREERLLASLARRLKRRLDDGMDGFTALNDCQDHAVELGRAYADRFLLEHFQDGVRDAPPALRPHLVRLAALFALSRLESEAAWYLESGYMEGGKTRAIRRQVNVLCGDVRAFAVPLSTAFGIPDALLSAPVARLDREAGAPAT
jgi:acyl-CoA oxidase